MFEDEASCQTGSLEMFSNRGWYQFVPCTLATAFVRLFGPDRNKQPAAALQDLLSGALTRPTSEPWALRGCHNGNIRGTQLEMAGHEIKMVISCVVCRTVRLEKKKMASGSAVETARRNRRAKRIITESFSRYVEFNKGH